MLDQRGQLLARFAFKIVTGGQGNDTDIFGGCADLECQLVGEVRDGEGQLIAAPRPDEVGDNAIRVVVPVLEIVQFHPANDSVAVRRWGGPSVAGPSVPDLIGAQVEAARAGGDAGLTPASVALAQIIAQLH